MATYDVSIVQPYVPVYRVPLFDRLESRLASLGLRLQVVAPPVTGEQAERRDSSDDHPWLTRTEGARSVRVGPGALAYLGSAGHVNHSRVVILPLWGTLLDAHRLLWQPAGRRRIGLWGHVGAYVKPANRLDAAVERFMMRRAERVFAYTDAGGQTAIRAGVPAQKVTVLHNTVDVAGLLAELDRVHDDDVLRFRSTHALGEDPAYCYIGGLDGDKRIDLLAEALDHLYVLDQSVKVVVAGRGSQESLLDLAKRRGQVVTVGYADDRMKALLARVCDAVLSPGRIGLVAVDALAMGLPVVTTDFQFHAPEIDYLTDELNLIRISGGPWEYARFLAEHRLPSAEISGPPELDDMVSRFEQGILAML